MNKSKEEIHREYLLNKVNPIFEKLMLELIHHKPEKVVKFMENWINEKGSNKNKIISIKTSILKKK